MERSIRLYVTMCGGGGGGDDGDDDGGDDDGGDDDLHRRKSKQAEREYEKVKHQLESLEESVRDRCKKEFTGTLIV